MEAYCMSEDEVITRSAHRLLFLAPSLGERSCYRCVFFGCCCCCCFQSGVCFHLLHVLVGVALTKTSDACIFLSVCIHTRGLYTCGAAGCVDGACRLPSPLPMSPTVCESAAPPPHKPKSVSLCSCKRSSLLLRSFFLSPSPSSLFLPFFFDPCPPCFRQTAQREDGTEEAQRSGQHLGGPGEGTVAPTHP